MSLFGELDIASANENPFFKPDGTYHCELVSAEVKTAKSGNKGFALDYTIKSGPKEGKKIQEWKPVPHIWQLKGYATEAAMDAGGSVDDKVKENAERSMAFLKQRLKDFGIPLEEMNQIDRDYLLNKVPDLDVTIKNVGDRENVTGVKIHEGDSSEDPFA